MRHLLSILLFLVFLFPSVEKGVHIFEHIGEKHCAEHEKTHLHHKDHICNIDQFSFDANDGLYFSPEIKSTFSPEKIFSFYTNSFLLQTFNNHFLRGPPAIV